MNLDNLVHFQLSNTIFGGESRYHVTSLLRERLHWLHVHE